MEQLHRPGSALIKASADWLGSARPTYVIAEAGVNHNGDKELAHRLIDTASQAGADAVKFQTFEAADLVTAEAPKAEYQKANTQSDGAQQDMLAACQMPKAWYPDLLDQCRDRGIDFLSSPFEEASLDFLTEIGQPAIKVPAIKVPSGELTNLPFLQSIGGKGCPVILSTGMANLEEVAEGIAVLEAAGCPKLAILHCVSDYPADPGDVNLPVLKTLSQTFGLPVGYSDHVLGLGAALAAVSLGAKVIEKHITLDRTLPGPDHAASLEPGELRLLVSAIREAEQAIKGHGRKEPVASERATARVARKSLVAARDLAAGAVLAEGDLVIKRPGTGLSPRHMQAVLGRHLARDIACDQVLVEDDLSD